MAPRPRSKGGALAALCFSAASVFSPTRSPLQWSITKEPARGHGDKQQGRRRVGPAPLRSEVEGSKAHGPARGPTAVAAAAAAQAGRQAGQRPLAFIPLSTLFIGLLVAHKCIVDGLSRYTRVSGTPYSASTAAFLGEVVKIPVLSLAVIVFEGRKGFMPVLREAVSNKPFSLALPGLAYSFQNILYFEALSHLSVATYQILSQSKLLFTAFFMSTLLGRRLAGKQIAALGLLMLGTLLTQISEIPRSSALGGSALYGGLLTFAGALLSALPNVYYEKVLKTKAGSQWASNIQLTFWIWFWLVILSAPDIIRSFTASAAGASGGFLDGFTAMVWLVIWLQSFKCLLIPATLKYSDNIIYSYAKPLSILLTAVVTAGVTRIWPSKEFLSGAFFVLASIVLYES